MGKKLEDMTEQELNQHLREVKIKKDSKALRKYGKRLREERKTYSQIFHAYAINQRKSREAALGACALKAVDAVRELSRTKPLVAGTLEYIINEQKVKDETEQKGFYCSVTFHVVSNEPAYNPEDIQKELESTFEKMMRETDELYPVEVQDEKEKSDKETD